jgi:hypothetical protein
MAGDAGTDRIFALASGTHRSCMQTNTDGISQSLLIWHSAGFDRPKRLMLRAALRKPSARAVMLNPDLVAEVTWLLDRIDELEEVRNNTIHGPLFLFAPETGQDDGSTLPGRVMPDMLLGNPRARKLLGILKKSDLLTEYRWCRDAARTLSLYSVFMGFAVIDHAQPWPHRPRLPIRKPRNDRGGRRRPAASK